MNLFCNFIKTLANFLGCEFCEPCPPPTNNENCRAGTWLLEGGISRVPRTPGVILSEEDWIAYIESEGLEAYIVVSNTDNLRPPSGQGGDGSTWNGNRIGLWFDNGLPFAYTVG